jgi:hypothetical protein
MTRKLASFCSHARPGEPRILRRAYLQEFELARFIHACAPVARDPNLARVAAITADRRTSDMSRYWIKTPSVASVISCPSIRSVCSILYSALCLDAHDGHRVCGGWLRTSRSEALAMRLAARSHLPRTLAAAAGSAATAPSALPPTPAAWTGAPKSSTPARPRRPPLAALAPQPPARASALRTLPLIKPAAGPASRHSLVPPHLRRSSGSSPPRIS